MLSQKFGFSGMTREATALLGGNTVQAIGLGLFFPILPLFVLSRHGSFLLIGIIGAVALFGNMLAQGPGGWLADHYSRRTIVIVTMALYGIFFLVYLLPIPVDFLPAVRFLHAGLGGFYQPAARALLADVTPSNRRGAVFGHWQASNTGGFLIGPVIGGLLGVFSLQYVFLASAVTCLLGATLLLTWLPTKLRPVESAAHQEQPPGIIGMRRMFGLLLPAMLAGAAWQYAGGVYGSMWSLYVTALGGSTVIVGLTFSLYSLPIVLFSGAAGHLSDRFGTRSMVALSVGGLGAFALAYTITRSIPLVFVIGIIEGTATLTGFPAVMAYVSRQVGPDQQGRAQGLFSMFTAGGQALGALVGAYLFGVGIAWPFISVAAVCFISLLAVPLFRAGATEVRPPRPEAKSLAEL